MTISCMRGESLTHTERGAPMTATLTQVVKQFQQDWTSQLEPDAILTACRGVAYRWRERTLDPVTTIQVFVVQILHGNTACTHLRHLTKLNVTASALSGAHEAPSSDIRAASPLVKYGFAAR